MIQRMEPLRINDIDRTPNGFQIIELTRRFYYLHNKVANIDYTEMYIIGRCGSKERFASINSITGQQESFGVWPKGAKPCKWDQGPGD